MVYLHVEKMQAGGGGGVLKLEYLARAGAGRFCPQSTYIYRAPQCMSPRWNWDSPTPLAASECALPPGPKGGGEHSPAAKGVGESQFQRLEKRLALCLLCGFAWPNTMQTCVSALKYCKVRYYVERGLWRRHIRHNQTVRLAVEYCTCISVVCNGGQSYFVC
jgi:hypothetical protein